MKQLRLILSVTVFLFLTRVAFTDTPPPGSLQIRGATDGTGIGNVGDQLKVIVPSPIPLSISSPLPIVVSSPLPVTDSQTHTLLGSLFPAGGSIGNTSFGVSGTLPPYGVTPTFNLGTLNGAATNAELITINSTLGSPFQAGASIANTSFGISGTLPSFTSTQTFNLGTLNGAATAAKQPALGTAGSSSTDVISIQGISGGTAVPISGTVTASNPSVGTNAATIPGSSTLIGTKDGSGNLQPASTANPVPISIQSGSIGNTSFIATQSTAASLNATVVGGSGAALATSAAQTTGNTSLSSIVTNTTGLATSSAQSTGNSSLASIVTNTTGLATSSAQSTGNSSLASIVTNTGNTATHQTDGTQKTQVTVNVSPSNSTTSFTDNTTLGSSSPVSFAPPTNGNTLTVMASSSNANNVRCVLGGTATTVSGIRLEPGRSWDNIPTAATLSCIAETGTNQEVMVQWLAQ